MWQTGAVTCSQQQTIEALGRTEPFSAEGPCRLVLLMQI
jgi:hypothetical protein